MNATLPLDQTRRARLAEPHDQFVVSHGKSGGVGVFTALEPLTLRRGDVVVIETTRGIEIGTILCPASLLQARVLGATSSGQLLRPLSAADEARLTKNASLAQTIFDTSKAWSQRDQLPIEILDVEVLFDESQAILQFVGEEAGTEAHAQALEAQFGLTIRMENLAPPTAAEEEHAHACDKPDCGRSADGGGGGCTSCSTGGGCSSCGSAKVDMRDYFAHLRSNMEADRRIPLA